MQNLLILIKKILAVFFIDQCNNPTFSELGCIRNMGVLIKNLVIDRTKHKGNKLIYSLISYLLQNFGLILLIHKSFFSILLKLLF